MKTSLILSVIALCSTMSACTVQGTQRFTPTGLRVGSEVGLGSGAFEIERERDFDQFPSNYSVTVNNYNSYEEPQYPMEIAVYNRHDCYPNAVEVVPVW